MSDHDKKDIPPFETYLRFTGIALTKGIEPF